MVLAWPASLGDQFTSIRVRAGLARLGAQARVLDALLGSETLPSASHAELATISTRSAWFRRRRRFRPTVIAPGAPRTACCRRA